MPKYVAVTWTVSAYQLIDDEDNIEDAIEDAKDVLCDIVAGYSDSQIKDEAEVDIIEEDFNYYREVKND